MTIEYFGYHKGWDGETFVGAYPTKEAAIEAVKKDDEYSSGMTILIEEVVYDDAGKIISQLLV